MSQRTEEVDESMLINLRVNVTIKKFSTHDGFFDGQVEQAKEEFEDEIANHLTKKLVNDYQMDEFLYSVDFVDYEVDSNGM